MSKVQFTDPEVLANLRREYGQRIEAASEHCQRSDLDKREVRAEEIQWARRHLLLIEKSNVLDAFHRGILEQPAMSSCSRTSTHGCCVLSRRRGHSRQVDRLQGAS